MSPLRTARRRRHIAGRGHGAAVCDAGDRAGDRLQKTEACRSRVANRGDVLAIDVTARGAPGIDAELPGGAGKGRAAIPSVVPPRVTPLRITCIVIRIL